MATKPNYAFEKRQREQEKKRKKAEKAQRKTNADGTPMDEAVPAEAGAADAAVPVPAVKPDLG